MIVFNIDVMLARRKMRDMDALSFHAFTSSALHIP